MFPGVLGSIFWTKELVSSEEYLAEIIIQRLENNKELMEIMESLGLLLDFISRAAIFLTGHELLCTCGEVGFALQ